MAADYIITITYSLDTGDIGTEAATAGKQAGDAFANNFKPQFDWVNRIVNPDDFAKKTVASFQGAFQKVNLSAEIEKSLDGVNFARTNFIKGLQDSVQKAIAKPSVEIIPPARPAPIPGRPEFEFGSQIQPLLSGIEAFAMLLRGAPLTSVAQMAGQAIVGYGAVAGPARIGAAAAAESEEARVARRLGAIPGAAAEEGAVGAEAGAVGRVGQLLKGGLALTAIKELHDAFTFIDRATIEYGLHAAEATEKLKNMAETMGTTRKGLLEFREDMSEAGVNADQFSNRLYRAALIAQRELPRVQKEVRDTASTQELAQIAVEEAERAEIKTRSGRELATIRAAKAEAELIKTEQTGAEHREQQARAVGLGVTGAEIGLRSAQMQRAQAAIQLLFAPQEARLADIRGPLGVEAAQLGRRGAQISFEEEQARYRRKYYGEEEDPQEVELREQRKDQARLQSARNRRDEASAHEEEAQLQEQKRVAAIGAGVGPQAQAEQQMLQALQNEQMAKLRVDQANTARKDLEISQKIYTQKMQEFEARQRYLDAQQGIPQATADERKAQIELTQRRNKLKDLNEELIPEVQKTITGEQPIPEGFDIRRVPAGAFRGAMDLLSGGQVLGPGGLLDRLGEVFRGPAFQALPEEARRPQMELRLQELGLGGIRGQGGVGTEQLLNAILQPRGQRSPEAQRDIDKTEALMKEREEREADLLKQRAANEEAAARGDIRTGLVAQPRTKQLLDIQKENVETGQDLAQLGLGLRRYGEAASRGLEDAASGAAKFATEAVNAAGRLMGIQPQPKIEQPSTPTTTPAPEVTATEQQTGGLLHGLGTGTSDSIPIRASAGEYVIRASQVAKVGVPFLDALNEGRMGFQQGGLVATPAEYQRMIDLGLDPTDPQSLAFVRRFIAKPKIGVGIGAGAGAPGGGGQIARIEVFRGTPRPPTISYPPGQEGPGVPGMTIRRFRDLPGYRVAPGAEARPTSEGEDGTAPITDFPFTIEPEPPVTDEGFQAGGPVGLTSQQSGLLAALTPQGSSGYAAYASYLFSPQYQALQQQIFSQWEKLAVLLEKGAISWLPEPFRGTAEAGYAEVQKTRADVAAQFGLQFARGGLVGGITDAIASIPGYAEGGVMTRTGSGASILGFHQLDLRTNAGNFSAGISEDTMEGIRRSSLGSKLSQTGQRPTWFS